MTTTSLPVSEFRQRRDRVLEALGGAVGLVFAGEAGGGLHGQFKVDGHFAYLTGITSEPGAAVLFDPHAEDPAKRTILFMKPLAPETEAWDGLRDPISIELKSRHGFESIMRTTYLPRTLTGAARLRKRLACLHPFSVFDAPIGADLAVFRKVSERVLGCAIEDKTNLIPSMRAVKSDAELALMRRAVDITAEAYNALRSQIRAGVNEKALQRTLESTWFGLGASGNAYNPIVGAGKNSTVLHYNHNNLDLGAGDVLLVDAAAAFGGYCADITRTYPIDGRFTARQREIYSLVLKAQAAAIAAVKPGAYMHEVDGAARAVFREAKMDDYYVHGIGHQLGLDVHDSTPDGALVPGMVVTIEPGLYLPDEKIGVRIEDDILVTASGNENLSAKIPKQLSDIER